jgi:2-polyprenyl-3-methyl-5-hydroxy-6-metoxy-1,4-benzoquinol methylase
MTESILHRICPVCESASNQKICEVKFELFDGHPMNGGYNVVQCEACGFVYADTRVTQNELDYYYANLSKYEDKSIGTGGGFTENDKNRLIETAKFLAGYIKDKNSRILDLGCANGGLLRELKKYGFQNLVGIDPSDECVKITREEVGCECYQHSLFDIPDSMGKFDVVISTHVLEHLLNVRQSVSIIYKLLNAGGYVYIECPNASHYKDVIHAPFQEFNAEHINHFNEKSFQNLMGIHCFEKIFTSDKIFKISSDQDYHAVYGLFKKNPDYTYTVKYDNEIRDCIKSYINKSDEIFDEIIKTMETLPADIPVALYGVGQFAFKLLTTKAFQDDNDFKLFDNNRINVGKKIKGIEIMHGSKLIDEYNKEKFSVVISSLIYEVPIRKNIQKLFEENNIESPEMLGFSHLL